MITGFSLDLKNGQDVTIYLIVWSSMAWSNNLWHTSN